MKSVQAMGVLRQPPSAERRAEYERGLQVTLHDLAIDLGSDGVTGLTTPEVALILCPEGPT